jgi:molecular chaperone GrpE
MTTHDDPEAAPAPEPTVPAAADDATGAGAAVGTPAEGAPGALAEPPTEAVARLEGELDALKDRHLRLAAEFDNFRRRTVRERAELTQRAHAEIIVLLIDALDDLARFAHVDPATTDAKALHEGIDLVERKFWKHFTALGLTRIDQTGVPFDPKLHEAVMTAPAGDAAQDHTVSAVLQPGYKLGDALLRPARVQVLTWQGDG